MIGGVVACYTRRLAEIPFLLLMKSQDLMPSRIPSEGDKRGTINSVNTAMFLSRYELV